MRAISRPVMVVTASVAALALVAGCGGGSNTASTGTTDSTLQTPARATAPTTRPGSATSTAGLGTSTTQQSTPPPEPSAPATEFSPPGDIPDDQAFVPYSPPGGRVKVSVPEGWARSSHDDVVTFTDKLNSVGIRVQPRPDPPTVASVRKTELPVLARSVSQYAAGEVSSIIRQGGHAILVTYQQDSAPDPVTGKVIRDAVERYEYWNAGQEAIVTLSGPVGADNVDPWRIVSDSVSWK